MKTVLVLLALAQSAQPTFRAGVELVRLDVRVLDEQGRPIRDLTQDEVEVIEGGERRPVVFFQHIEEPADSYADVTSRTVASEVSTNQGAARGHLYVLVFDQQHLSPGGEQRARQAAGTFLRTRVRRGDRVALYALPGPGPQIGFTADARRVAAELIKVRGQAEQQTVGWTGTMTPQEAVQIVRGDEQLLQRVADRIQALVGPTDLQRRADPSLINTSARVNPIKEDAQRLVNLVEGDSRRILATLSDVLRHMRVIEGRKTIVLVSEGFYADRFTREIESVAAAAAESYSVIHAFDVNRRELDISADLPANADQPNAIHDKLNPLGMLATETGGTLVLDASRHAEEAFAALANQSEDYYLVGFSPGVEALKDRGAYHAVTVRVKRRGAQVSTRTGFTLTDAAAHMDRHQAIERALSAPFAQQGLPIQYTSYVLRGSAPGLQRVIVSLAAELPLAASDRTQPADVVFVVRSTVDGHVAASGQDTLPLPPERTQGTTGTGAYRVQFELPAGDYVMRAVVREPGGLVGSADRRFTVRALDGPALVSGDLILSGMRGELPVRPTVYTGDGLSGVLDLYARTTEQLRNAHVTVDLVPVGEPAAIVSGSCELQEVRTVSGGLAREARIDLPLGGVAAGTYIARARVLDGRDTASEAVREIEVRRGQRPSSAEGHDVDALDPREAARSAVARRFESKHGTRALERLGAADYPAAIAELKGAVDSDPSDGVAAFLLGWAFHGAGDDRQAISAWRRAAFVDPTLVPAHLALAEIYVRLSQPALAMQALRAGLAALPQSPELLDRLHQLERR